MKTIYGQSGAKDAPLAQGLHRVFVRECSRIHRIALSLRSLPPLQRHDHLSSLEQWERLQVIDELRHELSDVKKG